MKTIAYFSRACRTCYRGMRTSCRQVKHALGSAVRNQAASDIGERYDALQSSAKTSFAEHLIESESEALEHLMHKYRGRKVLVLSALQGLDIKPSSAFQSVWTICPVAHESGDHHDALFSRFDALPFSSATFDLVILQNVLEYSGNPQHVLKEAARVCDHSGHMIVAGFNPVSLQGVWSVIWGRLKPQSYWRRKNLLIHRVKDWLNFLDFSPLEQRNIGHGLPVSVNRRSTFNRTLNRLNLPFSPIYCLVSRKDVPGRIGGIPTWKRVMIETALPVAQPAQSTASVIRIDQSKLYK